MIPAIVKQRPTNLMQGVVLVWNVAIIHFGTYLQFPITFQYPNFKLCPFVCRTALHHVKEDPG